MKLTQKAVILISGGLDSTTCLAIGKSQGYECHTLSFDYGQKHQAELDAAERISHYLGAYQHKVVKLNLNELLTGSALTDKNVAVPAYKHSKDIPVTYVPARNTIFLSIALGWAEVLKANDIFIGVSSVDYSGYPDCRPEYIAQFAKLATLATKVGVTEGQQFHIHTPLIYLSKADTIKEGLRLGVDYSLTVSCYQADLQGHACGFCPSCHLRKRGFEEAGVMDPTKYY